MSKINKKLDNCTYRPTAMLVVYQNDNNDNYLEAREIFKDGTPGAGKPVTYGMMDNLLKEFSPTHRSIPHGPMPSNMLYADNRESRRRYVWWSPPARREMTFVPELALKDGLYTMPGVVYVADNDTLSVYAFHGRKPNPRHRLLRGPFFNYYEDCRMCLGSARCTLPEDLTWENLLKAWENLFWNSRNSHTIGSAPSVKGNLTTILKEMKDADSFDTSLLIQTNIKLQDLCKTTR
jgi:PRTRC genetic system protein B